MEDIQSIYMTQAILQAQQKVTKARHEFILPEHILLALAEQEAFCIALETCNGNVSRYSDALARFLEEEVEKVPEGIDYEPEPSEQLNEAASNAFQIMQQSGAEQLSVPHFIQGILRLKHSWAATILTQEVEGQMPEFISQLVTEYEFYESEEEHSDEEKERREPWRNFVTCLNDCLESHNPLIGRDTEMERTIQILCRKEKNNPLHVGESGVGKTALAYGLAAKIEKGEVPERLNNCKIYELDLGALVAGAQFRGDFEKRLKGIMEGIAREGNAIVYIDEIHNLVGAGRNGDSAMDATNLLKPYLEKGDIRFMGSTTYDEYNRYFSRSKGFMRRFQQIDIPEPSIDECICIINGLKKKYEAFHGVSFEKGVIEYAVKASARFITDRFLPDKAIDLLDEAGAYREIHPARKKKSTVSKELVTKILSRICKVDSINMGENQEEVLENLQPHLSAQIFGQDEAINQIVEAIQMASAGLADENKPMASLLFVGPTGVGKTEVARVLSTELGIALQRFDMSEYTEKHTVAKLIGSPAGYVGYEDGGLLTDAIRKTPNCVLLLDEIEKAHPDIFNILLQVMDYAVLTDNKGRKADCRHVILIMTSNAGAQFARQACVGFNSIITVGDAMMKQVKKTFKPEFINRLSGTVIFHDMNHKMASCILNKKLKQLNEKLGNKQVSLEISDEAHEWMLKKGFTKEYGARELDRIINGSLKSLLVKEILFGKLKHGGKAIATVKEDKLDLYIA